MSNPVFVYDAQGRPLMPMAASYARKLLQTHKAQLVKQTSFTCVALHHTVVHPQLQPIVAYVYWQSAVQLLILIQGIHSTRSLLKCTWSRSSTQDMLQLASVVHTLQQYMPLSHVVLDTKYADSTQLASFQHRLTIPVLDLLNVANTEAFSLAMLQALQSPPAPTASYSVEYQTIPGEHLLLPQFHRIQ